jgi:quercetin dioxygenase-like cupin family protein
VTVPNAVRLWRTFDAAALERDVDRLRSDDWVPHFNTQIYQGDWSGVSLRSVGGRPDSIYPDPAPTDPWADTEVLSRCPALRDVLSFFACELLSVRLLRLGPGARVAEHRDYRLGYEDGELRLHIPITTGPGATFQLAGERILMAAGECWYVNVNEPHSVANDDRSARIHLILDAILDPWLTNQVQRSLSPNSARA